MATETSRNPLSRKLLTFLADLDAHNDRDWFATNKDRYEADFLEPALAFIAGMAPRLRKVSKHVVADDAKVGGSMMRIFRDVRFSKDKRPYNPHLSMVFHHAAGKKVSAPGLYLRVEPGGVHAGVGIWRPEPPALSRIRDRIAERPREWKAARDDAAFRKTFGGLHAGDALKRPPKGYDPEHPCIEDLKRKDLVGFREAKGGVAVRGDFPDRLTDWYRSGTKLMRFLCKALDLPY